MAFGMSSGAREFVLKITADTKDATKGIADVEKSTSTMKDKALGIGKAVGGALAVGAVISFGKEIVGAASDAEQALGAMQAVFGESSDRIADFGEKAAKNLGISNAEFNQMSALMGSLLKNSGLPMDQVAASTENLTQRAADLAAMYGGTAADAMNAMTSALKGEMNPLENFGVSLKASTIEAHAMAQGYVDAGGKVTDVGKVMATQELILQQSADAAGTFAKESGSLAGQTQIMGAQFQDLKADLGKKLLPVIVKVAQTFQGFLQFIIDNQSWLLPLSAAITTVVLAVKAWSIAQGILNLALAANPIGLIVIAIAGLVAGLVVAYQKSEEFRNIVQGAMSVVKVAVDAVWEAIKAVAAIWWDVAQAVWNTAKTVAGWAQTLLEIYTWPYRTAFDVIKAVFEAIPGFIKFVWESLKSYANFIYDILIWPYKQAYNYISTIFQTIAGFGKFVYDAFRSYATFVLDIVKWPFEQAWTIIKWVYEHIVSSAKWAVETAGKYFGYAYDAIKGPFVSAFNAIAKAWNATVGTLSFNIPSWVGGLLAGKSWSMPKMPTIALAEGGIVTRATMALIGEAGPEAVIPLDQLAALMAAGDTHITIQVSTLTGGAEAGRSVYDALQQFERSSGRKILL